MRRKPPPPDSPQGRYNAAVYLGAEPALAISVVAESFGLSPNVVALTSAGEKRRVSWKLREIEQLVFLRWAHAQGHIGGPSR